MFVVAPTTVWNPGALEVRELPRRIGGRVTVWPVGGGLRLWARVVFEVELLRYLAALLPFALGALVWQDQALAIAQAPLLMFLVVYAAETKLMRLSPEARKALIDEAGTDRALDLLRVRARAILTRIAAGRGLTGGALRLVVEQSELARVAPLTWVSVQSEEGPEVMRLTPEEVALVRDTLFAAPLDERTLQRVNQREGVFLREERLEAREVSAHARLAALMG
ncbi:MAG TPA: hypothetical protein PKD10_07895 [Paracoccaceae bacterium]|nr:hypothetical protein [Paracoccaceae bacterium]HMO70662.1 hypothetical protein [Paracoccaceae bacterium]